MNLPLSLFSFKLYAVLHIFILISMCLFTPVSSSCRVDECTQWFQRAKDYESLRPSHSERYCEVLQTYIKCLNDTTRHCHGRLDFHSTLLVMRKDWREYGCAKMNLARSHGNRCHFLPPSSHRLVRYCALFGDPHLLRFDGTFETCSEEGARPLVENRYFLIQVTNANVHGAHLTTSVNKVTVLIREHNCTSRLRYEAAAETKRLSDAFVDGTTHVSVDQHKHSVELLRQDPDYVELRLRYIDTSIHLRRQGPYLSVAVRAPLHVLQTADSTAYQLCWAGCRKSDVIPVTKAINATSEFANCYQRKIHVPVKLATDRCKSLSENLTGSFLDACIFDFMLTGDEYLVTMSALAYSDVRRLSPYRPSSSPPPAADSSHFNRCIPDSASTYLPLTLFISAFLATLAQNFP